MSKEAERTLEGFRADAAHVLARIARARGIDGLRRHNVLNKLVNILGTHAVEEALTGPIALPNDAEIEALTKQAVALLREYPLLKARASAERPQLTLDLPSAQPLPPPPAPAPPSPPPQPPPVPYSIPLFVDPLFVREMTKPPPGPKPRDLASAEAVDKILARQTSAITAFFAPGEATGSTAEVSGWSAHFELGETLCIVTGPLAGLPGFVKTLDVVSGDQKTSVLGSNLRSGTTRIEVSPSASEYRFTAGAFDEELGEDLSALTLPGFLTARASAFRIDPSREGQLLTGGILSPGREYRLLLPPGMPTAGIGGAHPRRLAGGWGVTALALPRVVPDELRESLSRLGLVVARTTLDVELCGITAREWRLGRNRERYACFRPADTPVVSISGVETRESGELVVFLAGPSGQTRHSLPARTDFLLKLGPLPEGRYALDVLSVDMTREPERLLFEVDARAGRGLGMASAGAVLELGGERIAIDGDVVRDIDATNLDESAVRLTAPPLWRVRARWEGERSRLLPPLYADRLGEVPISELLALTRTERETERVADLWLDLGDIGRVLLRHERAPDVARVRDDLSRLYVERHDAIRHENNLGLVFHVWIEPICRALGYRTGPAAPLSDGLDGVLVFVLETIVRQDGQIIVEKPVVLVFGARGLDVATDARGSARDAAARLAQREGVHRAIVTNGFSWALWERGRTLVRPPVDIGAIVEDGAGARLDEFIHQFHA